MRCRGRGRSGAVRWPMCARLRGQGTRRRGGVRLARWSESRRRWVLGRVCRCGRGRTRLGSMCEALGCQRCGMRSAGTREGDLPRLGCQRCGIRNRGTRERDESGRIGPVPRRRVPCPRGRRGRGRGSGSLPEPPRLRIASDVSVTTFGGRDRPSIGGHSNRARAGVPAPGGAGSGEEVAGLGFGWGGAGSGGVDVVGGEPDAVAGWAGEFVAVVGDEVVLAVAGPGEVVDGGLPGG